MNNPSETTAKKEELAEGIKKELLTPEKKVSFTFMKIEDCRTNPKNRP